MKIKQDDSQEDSISVSVIDTGCGIEEEQLPFIFHRLRQTRESDTKIHGGLGLGLYLCHEIVSLHQGRIFVVSEIGKGSCFTFSLKKAKEDYSPHFDSRENHSRGIESLTFNPEEREREESTQFRFNIRRQGK